MILQSLYRRMDSKEKLFVTLLMLLIYSEDLLAKKSVYNPQPQVSCRYLRHVYRYLWYKPKCNPDGSLKNPQCFRPAQLLKICCCTYEHPLVNRAIKWIGKCTTYPAKSKGKPICKGPIMVSKYPYYKAGKKVQGKTTSSGKGQQSGMKAQGKVNQNSQNSQNEQKNAAKG